MDLNNVILAVKCLPLLPFYFYLHGSLVSVTVVARSNLICGELFTANSIALTRITERHCFSSTTSSAEKTLIIPTDPHHHRPLLL